MRKLGILLAAFLWFATAQAWVIEDFSVVADIQTDGSVFFQETITADFSDNRNKRGIFRDLPFVYEDETVGKTFKTPITDISVTDEDDIPRPFEQKRDGSLISLKIGDPNVTVAEKEIYNIRYRVAGVLNRFDEHDELYWNVSGDGWETLKQQVSIRVVLPKSSEVLKVKCFTGVVGSVAQDCETELIGDSAVLASAKVLAGSQDLTIVAGFDRGLVPIPDRHYEVDWLKIIKFFLYGLLLYPLSKIVRALWRRHSQREPLVPLYEPPENVSLPEVGYLYDFNINMQDLAAIITSLCVDGAMKMKVLDQPEHDIRGYQFIKLDRNKADTQIKKYVFEKIFLGANDTFTLYPNKTIVQSDSIFGPFGMGDFERESKRFFKHDDYFMSKRRPFPKKVSTGFGKQIGPVKFIFGLIFLMMLIQFVAIAVFTLQFPLGLPIALLAASALFVPRLIASIAPWTAEGAVVRNQINGYLEFLETAEKDRINWSEAQNIFETHLPYAITFGLTDKWVSLFEGVVSLPVWLEGTTPAQMSRDLENTGKAKGTIPRSSLSDDFKPSANYYRPRRTMSSSRRSGFSSRGGRSGGGHGGGGGRSW